MKELPHSSIEALDALIQGAGRICLTTHMRPDGDAVGSTYAMYVYLKQVRGREVSVVLSDAPARNIAFAVPPEAWADTLAFEQSPSASEDALARAELIICLDFNTLSRVGGLESALAGAPAPKVLIDHHPFPQTEKFDLVFSDTDVSSASELLLHVLRALTGCGDDLGVLPRQTLRCLMTGITTDTNNFANSVWPTTLECCSALLAAGVDREDILDHLYKRSSEARVRAYGRLISDFMFITPQGAACIILDAATFRSMGLVKGDTEGLVNIPLEIEKVKMSIFVHEEDGEFRVSVRSKRGVLANAFASGYFNGGGHDQAAGGRLKITGGLRTAEDIKRYVCKCVEEYFG